LRYGLPTILYGSFRAYLSSIRVIAENEAPVYKNLSDGKNVIAAIWHQRLFSALAYSVKYREFNPLVMISQSRDGDLISPVAERLGLKPVRGSSSRGGGTAFMAMIEAIEKHHLAGHVVDGPRGPKGIVKPGLVKMAQISGASVFPLFFSAKMAWITKSWDRFLIPKPFTEILVRWGDPVRIPQDTDTYGLENFRIEIEKKLIKGHARDDLRWNSWEKPL
jgi:lysophospholipid acyltransferase (LPLAT)-like uncharacterized protein